MFSGTPMMTEYVAERGSELAVEDAVDDRVHGAVDVTEPREDGEDHRRHAAGTAQRADQVDREERTPRPPTKIPLPTARTGTWADLFSSTWTVRRRTGACRPKQDLRGWSEMWSGIAWSPFFLRLTLVSGRKRSAQVGGLKKNRPGSR